MHTDISTLHNKNKEFLTQMLKHVLTPRNTWFENYFNMKNYNCNIMLFSFSRFFLNVFLHTNKP